MCVASIGLAAPARAGVALDTSKLPGVLVDDTKAELTGKWTNSTSAGTFINQGYIHAKGAPATARFKLAAPKAGRYHVRVAYTAGSNRESKTPVRVEAGGKTKTVTIDQRKQPSDGYCFHDLGAFDLAAGGEVIVEVSTKGTTNYVIADAAHLLAVNELKAVLAAKPKSKPAAKPAPKKADAKKPAKPAPPPVIKFERRKPTQEVAKLTPAQLERMLQEVLKIDTTMPVVDDALFLRRATLDLVGRQPTREELTAFMDDAGKGKRAAAVKRLLESPDFGVNWANYWSDVIGYRQQEPELTYHDYTPFKRWLAEQFNTGAGWDQTVFHLLTAYGKVGERPAATFIGFHQGNRHRLAGETSRVFMGVRIACAECHDDPFVDGLTQERFHGMAAFFARTEAKIAQLNSDGIEVRGKAKGGEHRVPGGKKDIAPLSLDGTIKTPLGSDDATRRAALAGWLVAADNRPFAKAYVNRVWARLIGRGFITPIDDMGDGTGIEQVMPGALDALADHFVATGFDTKALTALIMTTSAYQRVRPDGADHGMLAGGAVQKMRGDVVFNSLTHAIGLPNVTPEREKKTGAVRFPPPPKSTRDLVNDAFGHDPSLPDQDVPRSMKQAMFLMNNTQVQAQINASADSKSLLSKLLNSQADDAVVTQHLYESVLARRPSAREEQIVKQYLAYVGQRGEAYEDLLWSLINSAEFTTRH